MTKKKKSNQKTNEHFAEVKALSMEICFLIFQPFSEYRHYLSMKKSLTWKV